MLYYLMFLNIYSWEKLTFWKLVVKLNFSERKFEEMHYLWRTKMHKVYLGKTLFWHYYLQLSFIYKNLSQISFKLLCSGHKRLLSGFLRKWGWFQGHNVRFPKYLGKKIKIETRFCRWDSTDNNDNNILLSLENPCTFLLAKEKTWKRVFNTNCELFQNRTEQIMPFKTTVNWLRDLLYP